MFIDEKELKWIKEQEYQRGKIDGVGVGILISLTVAIFKWISS
jgi:hypothetical protein